MTMLATNIYLGLIQAEIFLDSVHVLIYLHKVVAGLIVIVL